MIALSIDEIRALTGKVRPSAQEKVLRGIGIPCVRRKDGPRGRPGSLLVLRAHVLTGAAMVAASARLEEPQVQP